MTMGTTNSATLPDPPRSVTAPRFLGARRIGEWVREVPRPGEGELLLAVAANAVCGTDRKQYEAGSDVVPGHEAAGVVVAAGRETTTPLGTSGVVFLMDFCGTCRSCTAGATNQCLAKRSDMGFTHDGGYGPYELVHETNLFVVPPALPLSEATLLLDVMGTTGHAIERSRLVTPEIRAVGVSGAGPLGLDFVVMVRLLLGDEVPVIVGDIQPERLLLIEELGGRPVDLRARSFADGLRVHGLAEVDVAFDTAGRTLTRRALLDVVAKRGSLVCVGHGESLELPVSDELIAPERAILGSEYFRYDELPRNLELLMENRDALAGIITHRFRIGELATAFEVFLSGVTGKVVVEQ